MYTYICTEGSRFFETFTIESQNSNSNKIKTTALQIASKMV